MPMSITQQSKIPGFCPGSVWQTGRRGANDPTRQKKGDHGVLPSTVRLLQTNAVLQTELAHETYPGVRIAPPTGEGVRVFQRQSPSPNANRARKEQILLSRESGDTPASSSLGFEL